MTTLTASKIPWPDYLIDASQLFALIARELGAVSDAPISPRVYDRAFTIEQYIDKARRDGKIKRYVYKHPGTGEAMAYGYSREDVVRLVNQASSN
jgi:hypothetical protein